MFLSMTKRVTTKRPVKPSFGLTAVERDVLIVLFQLSRDTQHISAQTLAEAVEKTPTQTGAALVGLEHAGLVDATRARLTMKGLVVAAQLGAGTGGPRIAAPKAVTVRDLPAALPLAALPSQPPPAGPTVPAGYEREASIGLLS